MIASKKLLPALVVVLFVAVAAAACGGEAPAADVATEPASDAPQEQVAEQQVEGEPPGETEVASRGGLGIVPLPELTGDERIAPELAGILSWINTLPFTLEELRGKVVLIDFWTYTCINCIRTMPFLRDWHEKYADRGLEIVGVHAPEFVFEKKRENVIAAAEEFGLEYRIVQDNDFETWRAYQNRFWPAKYLIDKDGFIRYTHLGEGNYAETESAIRQLLEEAASSVTDIALETASGPAIDPAVIAASGPATGMTRELYAGFERNYGALQAGQTPPYVVQREYYDQPNAVVEYADPGDHVNHFLYLEGLWRNTRESVVHARETASYEDYMAIRFYATSVNVVMSPEDGEPYSVRVTMDGRPLIPEAAGVDITFDEAGNSLVTVDEPRMYRLVLVPRFGGHDLKLSSNSDDFEVFAFTFGAFKAGSEG